MRRFLAFGLTCLVLFFLPVIPGWAGPAPPKAVRGLMDIGSWDFKRDGPVPLSGEWDFFWQTLMPPGSEHREPDARIKVPGVWNGIPVNGEDIPGQGFATYRLRVLMPKGSGSGMGIKVLDAATALAILVNGKNVYRSGIPGKTREAGKPAYDPKVIALPHVSGTLDILVHVSNFHHWQGGLWEPITLGRTTDLIQIREDRLFFDALLYGSILIMGLYHLFLYGFRPQDRSPLYFGLFCLLTSLRPLFHGERFILTLLPDTAGFLLMLKLNYIAFYLSVPLFSWYTLTLFPRQVSAKVVRLISLAGVLAAFTPLVLPPVNFTALMPLIQAATIGAIAYGSACLVRSVRAEEPDAGIFTLGFAVFFAAIVNDVLYTRQFISTTHLVPAGLFTFILCQAVLLARRFSLAFFLVSSQQQDLTEEMTHRKRVERDLMESESRYRMMADFMPIPLCETDVHLNIVYANKAALDWFGYGQAEMATGLPLSKVLAEPGMEDFAQFSRRLKQAGEFLVLKQDGTRVWAQVETAPILNKSTLSGHRICFVDLTERKKAEAASLHEAEQAKYILVGQVAGKMAHDFNNILSAVMGNAELSLMDCKDPGLRESLETVLEQSRRGQMLTQNLIAFAKDQIPEAECIDLNESADRALHLLRRNLEKVSVIRDHCPDLPEILADPGMIEQSLVNIIQNAVHAMSLTPGPELRIRTFTSGDRAGIEILDNGCGIPEKHHKDIYTPSFTLKGSRDREGAYAPGIKGTGYGMATVKKYMDKHRGEISFTSVRAKGTAFTLTLPAVTGECTAHPVREQGEIQGIHGVHHLYPGTGPKG